MVGGFVVSGNSNETVLIRAVGPTLGGFGVAGTLPRPLLVVYDSGGSAVAQNLGWQNGISLGGSSVLSKAGVSVRAATTLDFSTVGAFSLVAGSTDSALVATLPPGSYTINVSAN